MLELKNLDFSYKNKTIFQSLNVDFNTEVTAIMGENGAGKTTLLKLITGLLREQAGVVQTDLDLSKTFACFGEEGIFQNMTVEENISFYRAMMNEGKWNQKLTNEENKLIDAFKMREHLTNKVKNLSSGLKKRTQFICGLSREISVVLLDEPTNAIDYETLQMLKELIHQFSKKNIPVILVSHDLKFIYEVSTRVLVLENGKIISDAKTNEFEILDEFEQNYAQKLHMENVEFVLN
jgi:ABC-type multidrug transport system ATPase subunit